MDHGNDFWSLLTWERAEIFRIYAYNVLRDLRYRRNSVTSSHDSEGVTNLEQLAYATIYCGGAISSKDILCIGGVLWIKVLTGLFNTATQS